jgi:hypothetical protein
VLSPQSLRPLPDGTGVQSRGRCGNEEQNLAPCGGISASGLVQNQGTLLAMVSSLFRPLIKGGQGGFTGKARHAQKGFLNMH